MKDFDFEGSTFEFFPFSKSSSDGIGPSTEDPGIEFREIIGGHLNFSSKIYEEVNIKHSIKKNQVNSCFSVGVGVEVVYGSKSFNNLDNNLVLINTFHMDITTDTISNMWLFKRGFLAI